MGVQRSPDINLLPALRTALDDFEVASNSFTLLVVHVSRLLVANPGVSSSSSRVDPHDVFESKIISQCDIYHLDGHSHELPAFVADVRLVAASSDIVVISQIDIETQLF